MPEGDAPTPGSRELDPKIESILADIDQSVAKAEQRAARHESPRRRAERQAAEDGEQPDAEGSETDDTVEFPGWSPDGQAQPEGDPRTQPEAQSETQPEDTQAAVAASQNLGGASPTPQDTATPANEPEDTDGDDDDDGDWAAGEWSDDDPIDAVDSLANDLANALRSNDDPAAENAPATPAAESDAPPHPEAHPPEDVAAMQAELLATVSAIDAEARSEVPDLPPARLSADAPPARESAETSEAGEVVSASPPERPAEPEAETQAEEQPAPSAAPQPTGAASPGEPTDAEAPEPEPAQEPVEATAAAAKPVAETDTSADAESTVDAPESDAPAQEPASEPPEHEPTEPEPAEPEPAELEPAPSSASDDELSRSLEAELASIGDTVDPSTLDEQDATGEPDTDPVPASPADPVTKDEPEDEIDGLDRELADLAATPEAAAPETREDAPPSNTAVDEDDAPMGDIESVDDLGGVMPTGDLDDDATLPPPAAGVGFAPTDSDEDDAAASDAVREAAAAVAAVANAAGAPGDVEATDGDATTTDATGRWPKIPARPNWAAATGKLRWPLIAWRHAAWVVPPIAAWAWHHTKRLTATGIERARPHTEKVLKKVHAPLDERGPILGKAVALIAVQTCVLAVVIWGFVFFVQAPVLPVTDETPQGLLVPEGAAPVANADATAGQAAGGQAAGGG